MAGGRGLSGLDTSAMWGSGSEHRLLNISSIYRWTVSFVLQQNCYMRNSFLCSLVGLCAPAYEHRRQSCGHACISIYCTKLPQLIWCHVLIGIYTVTFHLYCLCVCVCVCVCVCMWRCAHAQLCVLKWKKRCSILLQFIANIFILYKL